MGWHSCWKAKAYALTATTLCKNENNSLAYNVLIHSLTRSLLLSENHTACPRHVEYEIWMSKRASNVETVKKCLIRFVSVKFPYVIYIFTSVSSHLIIVIHICARVRYTTPYTCSQRIAFYLHYFQSLPSPIFSMLIHIRVFVLRSVGPSADCSCTVCYECMYHNISTCRCTFWIYSFAWQIRSGAMKYIRYRKSGTQPPPELYQHLFASNIYL